MSKSKWEEALEEMVKGLRRGRELRRDSGLESDPILDKTISDHFSAEVADPLDHWRRLAEKVKKTFKRDSGLIIPNMALFDPALDKMMRDFLNERAVAHDLDPALPKAEGKQKFVSAVAARSELQAGLDLEDVKDVAIIMGYHVEAGCRTFADASRKVLEELGENIRPCLKPAWDLIPNLSREQAERALQKTALSRNL